MTTIFVGKVYADWCGYCRELAPKWDSLKDSVTDSNISFVEYNEPETDNQQMFMTSEGHQIKVSGYPTIFKVHSINNKPEYYSGVREPEDIRKWILTQPKKKFRKSRKNKDKDKKKDKKNKQKSRKNR